MDTANDKTLLRYSAVFPADVFEHMLLTGYMLAVPVMICFCANGQQNMTALVLERLLLLLFFFTAGSVGPYIVRKTVMLTVTTVTAVLDVTDLFCLFQLRSQVQVSFIQLLETTTASECTGFIRHTFFHWENILLLYPAVISIIYFCCKKHRRILLPLFVFCAIPAGVFLSGIKPSYNKSSLNYYDRIDSALDVIAELQIKEDFLNSVNSDLKTTCSSKNMTAVLIIGESHSKYHNQLYGYPRETSPLLKKRADAGELAVFTDAVAPHSFTIYSIPKLLTLAAHDRKEQFWQVPNIFDFAKSAGFKTFWICNHSAFADNAAPYSIITSRADVVRHSSPGNVQQYDEVLLPLLRSALDDKAPRKLIVIQLIGSHHDYENTYPQKWNFFPPGSAENYFSEPQKNNLKLVNAYHNSLRYNDFIIDSMISEFSRSAGRGFVLYVPDHGENLYEQPNLFMHMEFWPTRYSVEVPMYIYLSPAHPGRSDVFNAVNKPFATEDLPFLLLDLAEIKYHGKYAKPSLLSDWYRPKKRIVSRCGTDHETLKSESKRQ